MNISKVLSIKSTAILFAGMLMLNTGSSFATTVSLVPETTQVKAGETFSLDLIFDFGSDEAGSAVVDIVFDDTFIKYQDFAFNAGFTHGGETIDPQTSELVSVGVGSIPSIPPTPFTGGPFTIGTLTFIATSEPGVSAITISKSVRWGGFGGITLDSPNISVEVQAVPLPSAVWFLGSSLIGLISLNRRKAS